MKLCKDCKHRRAPEGYNDADLSLSVCTAAKPSIDLVTGAESPQVCRHERIWGAGGCGAEGMLWEAKQ